MFYAEGNQAYDFRKWNPYFAVKQDDVVLDGTLLEEHFDDWQAILALRDRSGGRNDIVRFALHNGIVKFALDEVEGLERLQYKDGNMPYQLYFMDPPFNRHNYNANDFREHEHMKNIIFFRPKDGEHKDVLFRFTVAQDQSFGNVMGAVCSSFIQLLLAGNCNFTEICYYARPGSVGYPVTFPKLPLEQLLPRADAHEFVRIDFDENACETLLTQSTMVEKFGFNGCKFWDHGIVIGRLLQSSHRLKDLQIVTHIVTYHRPLNHLSGTNAITIVDEPPVPDAAFSSVVESGRCSLKSLTVCVKDLVNTSSLRALCAMPGIEYLKVKGKLPENSSMGGLRWQEFVDSKIEHHPTLKKLIFYDDPPVELWDSLWTMTQRRVDSPLERILVLNGARGSSDEESLTYNYDADVPNMEATSDIFSQKAAGKKILSCSYRFALLSDALARASRKRRYHPAHDNYDEYASRDFTFSLLKQNADLFHKNE